MKLMAEGSSNGDGKGVNSNTDKSGAFISNTSLTKDNLDEVADGAAKVRSMSKGCSDSSERPG
ncbi:MAG: hypothetical protein Q9192_001618 [Flavoplaca navasiana]